MYFLRCVCYFAVIGVAAFVLGRLAAGHRLPFESFPLKSFPFEREGQAYKRIGIAKWQSRVPDMSRILKGSMPEKRLEGRPDKAALLQMIQETCVAETVHVLLCVVGLGAVWLWPGAGGWISWLVYCLVGNLPFILIQRYNRPRLVKLLRRCRAGEDREK